MILSLRIACKFHQSYKKNILVSLVSLIAVIGMIIGIAVSIIASSIVNGFEYELNKRILSFIPHGEIVAINIPFTNWQSILNEIKKIPDIISATPYLNIAGIIEFNNKWNPIYIKTIDLNVNDDIYKNNLVNFIGLQFWEDFCANKNQIILGEGLSNYLNIKIGDWIDIFFIHDTLLNQVSCMKKIRMRVSGILNLHSQLDENLAIISLSDAQNYLNNRLDIDGIAIFISNIFDINRVIKKINKKFNRDINVHSWIKTHEHIYRDIQIVRCIIYMSVILIIGASCFNIIASLILSIKNKTYDIIVLRALGARKIFIRYIFLWYGLLIYFISSILGAGIGILVSLNLISINDKCSIFFGKLFPKDVYFIDFIPSKLDQLDIFIILGIVFLFGLWTSWYISFKTSQIQFIHIKK